VNQNDGVAGALDHKMQTGVTDRNKSRERLRILMSDTRGEISSLESSGNIHEISPSAGEPSDTQSLNEIAVRLAMFMAREGY
jgi:hypothetical protein